MSDDLEDSDEDASSSPKEAESLWLYLLATKSHLLYLAYGRSIF